MISSKLQRFAMNIWPVTVLILTPLLIFEAVNLYRKNRNKLSNNSVEHRQA